MPRNPLGNSEVATLVNSPWIWALGREYEGKEEKFGLLPLSPTLEVVQGIYWTYKIKL